MRVTWITAMLPLLIGCHADAPRSVARSSTSSSSSHTVIAGWESVPSRRESLTPNSKPISPAEDSVYWSNLTSLVLRSDQSTKKVSLAPTDETDVINAQSAAFSLGSDADLEPRKSVFSVDYSRFSSGVLIIELEKDTGEGTVASDVKKLDSVAVAGLAPTERVGSDCKLGLHTTDNRLIGVVPDSVRLRWMRPRLAWVIDTVAGRIRPIRPDSLSCRLWEDPD